MSTEKPKCVLCDRIAKFGKYDTLAREYQFDCATCGRYGLSETAATQVAKEPALRGCLSIATREASDLGDPLKLDSGTWREAALSFASTPIGVKSRRLLELLRQRTVFYGEPAHFSAEVDWPLIHAYVSGEAIALVAEMQRRGLITSPRSHGDSGPILTMDGWSATEPAVGGVPGLGFVAMSFDESLSSAYNEGMKPAVETDCGLQLIRVDAGHFQEKICDRIIAEIRRSQFVIADFTKQRGGVYFEAGFALALGRIVIWTCREDDISNVHFDTRQYPHLVWSTPGDLRVKLADRVRALVPGAQA